MEVCECRVMWTGVYVDMRLYGHGGVSTWGYVDMGVCRHWGIYRHGVCEFGSMWTLGII